MNIKNGLIYLLSLVVVAVASSLITQKLNVNGGLSDQSVYLIGSATVTDAKRLPEYQKVSGPLAALSGGYVPLAFSKPNMIEGKLPRPRRIFQLSDTTR